MLTPEQITDLRKALNLKKTELAVKVGVSENTVMQWETGRRQPSGSALILLYQLKETLPQAPKLSRARAQVNQ